MSTTIRTNPRRILVVTLADLGDALLTLPALGALRQAHPDAQIDILTTSVGARVLHGTRLRQQESSPVGPPFDRVLVFEKHRFDTPGALLRFDNLRYAWQLWRQLRATPYDACVLLHHLTTWFGTLKYAALTLASGAAQRYGLDNGRGFFLTHRLPSSGFGAQHQADYWQQLVGLLGTCPPAQAPHFVPPPAALRAARMLLTPGTQWVALHPGAGAFAPARRWPPQRWAAVADALVKDGARIVLVGGPEEASLRQRLLAAMHHRAQVLDLGGRTNLEQLAAVLQHCDLVLGNDSGVAHLAAAVGTPVVAVFGPTDPHAWGPYGGEAWRVLASRFDGVELLGSGPHRALYAAIACSPCIYRGQSLGTPHGCADRTCLLRIDAAQVVALARQQLALHQPESTRNVAKPT